MNKRTTNALLKLCREVNRADDALGRRSDHEGTEDGPTYILFTTTGGERFEDIAREQIANHERAASVWKRLLKLRQKQP